MNWLEKIIAQLSRRYFLETSVQEEKVCDSIMNISKNEGYHPETGRRILILVFPKPCTLICIYDWFSFSSIWNFNLLTSLNILILVFPKPCTLICIYDWFSFSSIWNFNLLTSLNILSMFCSKNYQVSISVFYNFSGRLFVMLQWCWTSCFKALLRMEFLPGSGSGIIVTDPDPAKNERVDI